MSVLIASPGDVQRQREVVRGEVEDWNRSALSRTLGVRLEALLWELDAVPQLGRGDAQMVINRQLRRDADVVIGIFHTRLGTRTARADSGTAEEIEDSAREGKPVHVFVDLGAVPRDHDPAQLALLKGYLDRLSEDGLLRNITSDDELARLVRLSLDHDVAELISHQSDLAPWSAPTSVNRAARVEPIVGPPAAVTARDQLNQAADQVLELEAMKPESPMDGLPGWVSETYEQRRQEILEAIGPLLELVIGEVRIGDARRNQVWMDLLPVLARNPHRGGSAVLLNLTRAPGALLFHLGGVAAAASGDELLIGRLLSPLVTVEDPYSGVRPAAVSLRAELAFPTQWPSRDLSQYVLPQIAPVSGTRAASDAWERWTYLVAVATTYFSSTMEGVWVDHPYLTVSGPHTGPMETVVARRIRDSVVANSSHPLLEGGLCNGNAGLFFEAATTFESNFGEWANRRDWQALPAGGGRLPSGPHIPGEGGA